MTEREAIEKLNCLVEIDDIEKAHVEADIVLCEFLKEQGFELIVEAWEAVEKWYA